ncbi:MAG: DNA-3-methyladenine glycosylase [Dongiaceae bacterium]
MPITHTLQRDFFARRVTIVARDLIGCTLIFAGCGGVIVETEAYDHEDPASHCYGGRTARNASMFGPPGHAYVYRSYGIHWCLNFVCGQRPPGKEMASGVLIRALEPTIGISVMEERRGMSEFRKLCSGPGRLCQALSITRAEDGRPLDEPPFSLLPAAKRQKILVGPRIGLSRGVETPWRFGLDGSQFLSRPFA